MQIKLMSLLPMGPLVLLPPHLLHRDYGPQPELSTTYRQLAVVNAIGSVCVCVSCPMPFRARRQEEKKCVVM